MHFRFEIKKQEIIAVMKKRLEENGVKDLSAMNAKLSIPRIIFDHSYALKNCDTRDQGVQVWFLELPREDKSRLFLCHQITTADNLHHASVQVYIPENKGRFTIVRQRGVSSVACGTDIQYRNKLVQTRPN